MDPSFPPVVDLSEWAGGGGARDADIGRAWDAAFSQYGFAVVVGHGINDSSINRLRGEAVNFFAQPRLEKMRHHRGPYGCPEGGYTPVSGEAVSNSLHWGIDSDSSTATKDLVESYVVQVGSKVQENAAIPMADEYIHSMRLLLRRLFEISSLALGLPDIHFFDKYFDPTHPEAVGKQNPSLTLRLAHYPPVEGTVGGCPQADGTRYGAHTDYLTYTILCPDSGDWAGGGAGGLEMRVCGEWRPVQLPEAAAGGLVINAGDLIQRWTNDRWLSPVHRVVNPVPGSMASRAPRLSLVFFSGPLLDASISTISIKEGTPASEGGEGGHSRYEAVVTSEYLARKINPTAS